MFCFCDNCGGGGFAYPGNIAAGSIDAVGDFTGRWRPVIAGDPNVASADRLWNPESFGPPPTGAGLFNDPNVAVRNLLRGPGTWGLNAGVRKLFRFGERARAELGADVNNLFNHPLVSPDVNDIANLGNFTMLIDATGDRLRDAQPGFWPADLELRAGRHRRSPNSPAAASDNLLA
jgi:hypothetical protein